MKRADIILQLAPCFRDRFDFSVPAQYQEWLEMTALAAEPFVKLYADEEIAHRERLKEIAALKEMLTASQTETKQALSQIEGLKEQIAQQKPKEAK